jgi:hypothetical protein
MERSWLLAIRSWPSSSKRIFGRLGFYPSRFSMNTLVAIDVGAIDA